MKTLPARVRHKARGTTYRVLGAAQLQTAGLLSDGAALVVYEAESDGALWARGAVEFGDGRFEALPGDPGHVGAAASRILALIDSTGLPSEALVAASRVLRADIAPSGWADDEEVVAAFRAILEHLASSAGQAVQPAEETSCRA